MALHQCSYNINKAIIMIGSSYVSIGYTKIRVVKLVPLFFNKKIEIYLFSKQTVIGYDVDENTKKEVLISTSYIFFSIEKIRRVNG